MCVCVIEIEAYIYIYIHTLAHTLALRKVFSRVKMPRMTRGVSNAYMPFMRMPKALEGRKGLV